jgi:hypothetical protein
VHLTGNAIRGDVASSRDVVRESVQKRGRLGR